ncbi:MAG: primase, partial [Capsulimonas sp.]|nr:primase [Capsulimonas sp.]
MTGVRDDILMLATRYAAAGLSVIPIRTDGSKAPATGSWDEYQRAPAGARRLGEWFGTHGARGIAIVCGAVSGRLEVLDFDEPKAWDEWRELCEAHGLIGVVERLVWVETPSGGRHLYYRCPDGIEGNQKLARTAAGKVKIETRSEGGYVVAPGSPRLCHVSGLPYTVAQGDLCAIPEVTAHERAGLLSMARILNEFINTERMIGSVAPKRGAGLRPGEDYNRRGDFGEVLARHGWTHTGERGTLGLWRRPGKIGVGISATSNYANSRLFYVFSSNASPFESEKSYTPMGVYATLEHGGDFAAAARALGRLGFGEKPKKTPSVAGVETPAGLEAFPFTDLGNAERLIARHGADLRYCHRWLSWLIWDGRCWRRDESEQIKQRAKDVVRTLYAEAAAIGSDAQRKECAMFARRSESRGRIEAMVSLAQSEPGVPVSVDELDTDRWRICAANGTLDLRTGVLGSHRRDDLITKQIPASYAAEAKCPLWDAFLTRVLPDADVRAFVQRAAGYSLTGDTGAQCLFFLHGSGANGKSTLISTLLALLGEYGMQAAPDMLIAKDRSGGGPNNEIAGLIGMRLVATTEVDDGKRVAEGLVKQLTGGDRIRARFLHQEYFEFTPAFKIWFAANHKPQIRGADHGVWRRIKMIPFTETIPESERDGRLPEKLLAELPGILAWAVRGCQAWREHGLGDPAAVVAATDDYRGEMDVLQAFLEERCVILPTLQITGAALYTSYLQWCEENAERPIGKNTFGRRLQESHAIVPTKNVGAAYARGWLGIALRSSSSLGSPDITDIPDSDS